MLLHIGYGKRQSDTPRSTQCVVPQSSQPIPLPNHLPCFGGISDWGCGCHQNKEGEGRTVSIFTICNALQCHTNLISSKMSHLNIAFDRYASIGTVMHYILVISVRWMLRASKEDGEDMVGDELLIFTPTIWRVISIGRCDTIHTWLQVVRGPAKHQKNLIYL